MEPRTIRTSLEEAIFTPLQSSCSSTLPPENDLGNIEYKQQLLGLTDLRREELATQLSFRLEEGQGEAFFELGFSDDGIPLGLDKSDMDETLTNLQSICDRVSAVMTVVTKRDVTAKRSVATDKSSASERSVAEVLVRKNTPAKFSHLRICIMGSANHGKSTLLGVLTSGSLDNGRGSARSSICSIQHELESERTSSLGLQIIGFDAAGNLVNDNTDLRALEWEDITSVSTKVITFIDTAGHVKYLKTTVSGISGSCADYAIIIVEGSGHLTDMTYEHIRLCGIYRVPFLIVVTKTDITPADVMKETVSQIKQLPSKLGMKRIMYNISGMDNVTFVAKHFKPAGSSTPGNVIPWIQVSSRTGHNLPLLKSLLNLLTVPPLPSVTDGSHNNVEFSVMQIYSKSGVGTVVYGNLTSGVIRTGDVVFMGPDSAGQYRKVTIKSIHYKRSAVTVSSAGHDYCYALRGVKRHEVKKGMVLVSGESCIAVRKFRAEIYVQVHPATIKVGYEAHMHIGCIGQSVRLEEIESVQMRPSASAPANGGPKILRSKTRATVVLRFIVKPEYIKKDMRFTLREGRTRAHGKVLEILE